ncbi:MAG: TetR/AcrR family transcriptional regulator [Chloroflexi bacterium]|nr:TetR/AcrR family transcriptional regulator [Chloroflexota bacterium]
MGSRDSYHHGDLKNALIKAGGEILAREGISALSLRKVAREAGVSHSAPYAHFKDKQALIAAISMEGFRQLLSNLETIEKEYAHAPEQLLVEAGWIYMQFAMQESDIFRVMFSGILEKEKEYPDLQEVIQKTFQTVVRVVIACQTAGILKNENTPLTAMTIWSQIHGLICLYLDGQISHTILDEHSLRDMLVFALNQIVIKSLQVD